MAHAGAIHRVAGGEVVRAIEHHARPGHQGLQFVFRQLLRQNGNIDLRIQRAQIRARRIDLAFADILGSVEDLALQVGEIDRVRVGERDAAETGGGEIERCGAAEAAGADDQRMRRAQPLLSLDPDLGEKDVAAVAEELLVVQLAVAVGLPQFAEVAGLLSATGGGGVFTTGAPLR